MEKKGWLLVFALVFSFCSFGQVQDSNNETSSKQDVDEAQVEGDTILQEGSNSNVTTDVSKEDIDTRENGAEGTINDNDNNEDGVASPSKGTGSNPASNSNGAYDVDSEVNGELDKEEQEGKKTEQNSRNRQTGK